MKAITILQPWASLIACGAKKIETRLWETKYRGQIAIHAGKVEDIVAYNNLFPLLDPIKKSKFPAFPNRPPTGKVIAIAELIDCQEMTMDRIIAWRDIYGKNEISFGDFEPGRYAWILANIQAIKPVPAKGMQRIWNWAVDTEV
jgi:hypothetical protein